MSYSDPDGQSMTVSYQWRNVTQGTSLGTSAFQALDTTVAAPSDVIECFATVTDAGGESSTGTGTVDIVNRAPVLGTVTISPQHQYYSVFKSVLQLEVPQIQMVKHPPFPMCGSMMV